MCSNLAMAIFFASKRSTGHVNAFYPCLNFHEFYQLVLIVSGGLEFADGSCHHPRKLCVHGHEGVVPHDVTDLAELLVKVVGPNLFDATLLIGLKSGQGRGQTGSGKCSRGTRVVAGKKSQVQPLFSILCWLFHCKVKITVLFLTRRGLVSERL